MNERVCSALNPEVFPKYRRSLETASTQTEIAPAPSGVLERVVIIAVAENAPAANEKYHRPGADGNRSETETSSPGSVHTLCSVCFLLHIRYPAKIKRDQKRAET